MAHLVTDLLELYKTYFQTPYTITPKTSTDFSGTRFDAAYREQYRGMEVFLPIRLTNDDYEVYIPCATLRVTAQKTVIRTPVAERIGTVKEVFNIGDYKFDIKGVLIAETAKGYPDDEVYRLRMLFESAAPVRLINAVSDLFMDNSRNVCITDIDFPDAPAQELRCRPFSLSCESDSVTNLLVQ